MIKFSLKSKKQKGIATLPTVIVLSMIILAIVVSIASVAFNELLNSQGQAQSSSALFYAEAGARDALLRISRDKNYSCVSTDCYTVDFVANGCANSTDCAKIKVSSGVGTNADPKIITSKGIMKVATRTMQVTVVLDNGTSVAANQNGEITSTTWTEVTN